MRIVNRKEFLQLPSGILYCKYKHTSAYNICIKYDSWKNDWLYQELSTLWSPNENDSSELYNKLDKAESDSSYSFKQDLDGSQRDGSFDEDQMFLIYEKEDIIKLIEKLKTLI